MKTFLTKNFHIKLLALLAASLFWFFVLSNENTFFAFPDNLEIVAFNVPEGLAVVNDLGYANVTIHADQEVYKALTSDNFTVYVDLQGLAAGSKTVDVSVNSKKSEVSVIDIDPTSVQVILEELTTLEYPLEFEMTGEPEDNYTAFFIEPDSMTVVVSGAENVLDTVGEVVAVLSLKGDETEDVVRSVEIEVRDSDGNEINTLTVEPGSIELEALVELTQSQKTLGIKVNLEAPEDMWVISLSTVPQVIHVQGDSEILESIEYLETELIQIPSGSDFYETTVGVILPEGVTLGTDENDTIEVTVSLSAFDE